MMYGKNMANKSPFFSRVGAAVTLAISAVSLGAAVVPATAQAQSRNIESSFDQTFGTHTRQPKSFAHNYRSDFERYIAKVADGNNGRIGVAAINLATGEEVSILGDQRFPMASTSKIAIAATFLEGVEQGRWSLSSEYPLMVPQRSAKFSSAKAPVTKGKYLPAHELIELMITRSSNTSTDALLRVVGGPRAVNDWMRRAGISEFNLSRDIATLVRDDGEYDPASFIDTRDSATPRAMVQLLSGLYQGRWLSASSRRVIIGAMERCRTGKRRIPANLPSGTKVAHKTGSLNNTSSDIGFITGPNGQTIALAVYVTGQGTRRNREARIASIANALYTGYRSRGGRNYANARYRSQ